MILCFVCEAFMFIVTSTWSCQIYLWDVEGKSVKKIPVKKNLE